VPQDQPLLKVPYELARKNFKTSQRHVERDRDAVLLTLSSAADAPPAPAPADAETGTGPSATLASLDGMIARMEGLKRKLETQRADEAQLHRQTRRRIEHLAALHAAPSLTDARYAAWARVRLDRLLVDYLLRQGYGASAAALARAAGVEELVDVDAFARCGAVEASLLRGSLAECLAWCGDNRQALRKINVCAFASVHLVKGNLPFSVMRCDAHGKWRHVD